MAMKRCPVCGERYSDTYKTCPFCEEDEYDEYWEDEVQEGGRPLIRDGGRGSSRAKNPYGIVTPILIILIVLMAALLIYLLYGNKIKPKDPDSGDKPGITEPNQPGNTPATDPATIDPDGSGSPDGTTPDGGSMPEDGSSTGDGSGGMSYATAAALPSGLTLSTTDFSRSVSEGGWQLKVSGGTGTYTWISENPAIATVSSDGTVTPIANGNTNILVTDGTKKATCIVRVKGGSKPASTGGNTTAPTATPAPSTDTPSSSGGSLKTGKAVVVNGGNGVRVRSGPGTNYEILASIKNGGDVQIIAKSDGDWYQITFVNSSGTTTTGYMKGEFLSNS